jgi:hypothetical protein
VSAAKKKEAGKEEEEDKRKIRFEQVRFNSNFAISV